MHTPQNLTSTQFYDITVGSYDWGKSSVTSTMCMGVNLCEDVATIVEANAFYMMPPNGQLLATGRDPSRFMNYKSKHKR